MPRPKLSVGAGVGAGALDEAAAVEAAQAWYDTDRRSPSQGVYAMVTPVLGAYRNSAAEWSLLYRVEPDTGTSYLFRYKYNQAGSSRWKVASAAEEGACMHADTERDVPTLDEAAAVKAAKRWYDKQFFGGAYTLCVPHVNAYCNRAQSFPREWSLRYRAEGPDVDPAAEHFVKFKYAAERKEGKAGWKWRVVCLDLEGATEDVDPAAAVLAAAAAAPAPKPAASEPAAAPAPKAKMPKIPKLKSTKITVGSSSSSSAAEKSDAAVAAAAASPEESKPGAPKAEKKTKLKVGSSAGAAPAVVKTEPTTTTAAAKNDSKKESKSAAKKASKAAGASSPKKAAAAAAAAAAPAIELDKDR